MPDQPQKTITYDIDDPAQARSYVADFAPRLLGKDATYVRTTTSRLIHFRTMSDDDACWVARQLWAMEQNGRGP
jgi:hypothetical protein